MTVSNPISPQLNAICPYFTMFPFDFPASVIAQVNPEGAVFDPFCGRGTTNLAARVAGLPTAGIDSNPVAVAVAKAKLVHSCPDAIVSVARDIIHSGREPVALPKGEFWSLAYHPDVLRSLCLLRESLIADCRSSERVALRAIVLGALHGPLAKGVPTYFSNQAPRTYAPKPTYAARFWRSRNLTPPRLNVVDVISLRADRYYGQELSPVEGSITLADSRSADAFAPLEPQPGLIITSPPYYGMRTYIPDQWLRGWFIGGPETVDYSQRNQIRHGSPSAFADELRTVWRNAAFVARSDAQLVIRFGAINDRKVDARELIGSSLKDSGWRVTGLESAGTARHGRRQASQFARVAAPPLEEYDVTARRW